MKFSTASLTIICRPSVESRDLTATASPVAGSSALMPTFAPIHEVTATIPPMITNSQNGSGSLLPIFSTTPRKPEVVSLSGLFAGESGDSFSLWVIGLLMVLSPCCFFFSDAHPRHFRASY